MKALRNTALLGSLVLTTALLAASPALAATASSNWAGYAAHRAGVHFRNVLATWRVPEVDCAAGSPAWSSSWVGLGGYSESSSALEQTGIESDCSSTGHPAYAAWYELVPSPARRIALTVSAGQLIRAAVSVSGHRVTITLEDLTTHRTFRRAFEPAQVDTTSAEWIVEAPSGCTQSGQCQTLPLADFGTMSFSSAQATTASGHTAGVTSRSWRTTRIILVPDGRRFVSQDSGGQAEAVPSGLADRATTFAVSYRQGGEAAAARSVSSARLKAGRVTRLFMG